MDKTIIGNMELSSYNGVWSLIAVREYQGKYYQQWCKVELGKEKKLADKSQPVKVTLGTKEDAINALTQILNYVSNAEEGVPF